MTESTLAGLAELLRRRNRIDADIAAVIGRPMTSGHLGEWIASVIFDIGLEDSANAAAIDGRFRSGFLQGKTVNVKWYLKREGLLDTTDSTLLDYYLVMTGARTDALASKDGTRPWCLTHVYLFDANQLRQEQSLRRVRSGTASSVRLTQWEAAEIFPRSSNSALKLSEEQKRQLSLFGTL